MQTRELDIPAQANRSPNLVFRTPINWTYVIFFAGLGGLHLTIAALALMHGRAEAYLSIVLGAVFVSVAAVSCRCRFEMTILPRSRRIHLRTGTRRLCHEREISFANVHGVRLTLSNLADASQSRIQVLCDNEDIECPPTTIPRQEALCLAMLMNVRLIKVCGDEHIPRAGDRPNRNI